MDCNMNSNLNDGTISIEVGELEVKGCHLKGIKLNIGFRYTDKGVELVSDSNKWLVELLMSKFGVHLERMLAAEADREVACAKRREKRAEAEYEREAEIEDLDHKTRITRKNEDEQERLESKRRLEEMKKRLTKDAPKAADEGDDWDGNTL